MNERAHDAIGEHGDEPPGADVLAGEYVLGLLDAPARREAEARIAADAGFARLVHRWEHDLAALLEEIAPEDVPPHLWPGIRSRLGWAPVVGTRRGLWHNIGFWRAAAGLATAAAVAVVFLVRTPPLPEPVLAPPPIVHEPVPTEPDPTAPVTVLAGDDGRPGWLATVDTRFGSVRMVPVPAEPDAQGRVAELWLIPEGQPPRSLGLVSTSVSHSVDVPADLQDELARAAVLAVTLEPEGGAPEGVPTGPVVASGEILLSP